MQQPRSQKDFREEIESHLQLEIDRLIAEGMSPEQANAQARRHFGNVTTAEERFYERNRFLWLDNLWRDFVYAARGFLRQLARRNCASSNRGRSRKCDGRNC